MQIVVVMESTEEQEGRWNPVTVGWCQGSGRWLGRIFSKGDGGEEEEDAGFDSVTA